MICKYCLETKTAQDFYPTNHSRCKKCVNLYVLERQRKNPEIHRERHKRWINSADNKEKVRQYYKNWYKKNGRKRDPIKTSAHNLVNRAIDEGRLQRPNVCSNCNLKCRPEGHHNDYFEPLEVIWLCNGCHRALHTGI